MNMQAMLKQAQKMQKDMMTEKNKIDETIYEATSSIVHVKVRGTKEVQEIKIVAEEIEKDEIEMLEDMIVVAINDAMKQIDKDTETKLGKYTKGMPGLF